ncbi:MAG TPA: hypothetical protein DHV26_03965 [Cytophagales bacterium]|nr:hypothetical protein [Cytophagales bacterium]
MVPFIFRRALMAFLIGAPALVFAQAPGNGMFVAYNSDGNQGFAFVTFVDVPNTTTVRFNDNEWNGSPIGGGGAFNAGESGISWTNNTGGTIFAGTVITITNLNTVPVASLGSMSGGTMTLGNDNEVIYMFIGTDASTPTTFITAIGNDGFGANGSIVNTGLTAGSTATAITGDEDIMIYNGSINCTGTVTTCATAIATPANWVTQDTAGDDSGGAVPNFPASVPCNFYGIAFGTVTYYSRNATLGGQWDSNTAWTTNSDGTGGPLATGVWPRRHDNVVIRSGHSITVNSTSDNRSCGVSPDGLALANVGPFVSSNLAMFYHVGDITISGTLNVTGIEMMTGGYTHVMAGGTFSLGSNLVQVGYLEVDASSIFSSLDDLVLTGNSVTIINTNSTSTDDLVIDHTNATLCGTGTATLQNGSGSQVTYTNLGTVNQICTSFTINCTGGGCTGFPVVGTAVVITGITGPGGIGASNGTSALVLWLDANRITAANGATVTAWNDVSGYGNNFTAGNGAVFNTNNVNGYPALSFNGTSHYFQRPFTASLATNTFTLFSANNVTASGFYKAVFSNRDDPPGNETRGAILYAVPTSNNWSFWTGHASIAWEQLNTAVSTVGSWATQSIEYRPIANGKRISINNAAPLQGTTTLNQNTSQPIRVGAGLNESVTPNYFFSGTMGEVIMYNAAVNEAQKIIINNYLAAKYAFTLSANDLYAMDDVGNGNFDHQVAGIGQASDGSRHVDAKGSGAVRMWNPSGLANNEFMIWGHNGLDFSGGNTAVDGVVIRERLNRIWRVSENSDVGSVSVSFDLAGTLGSALGSNLRLLIDRDGDGFADNDVTPVAGSFSGTTVTFSGINFQNGDRFTIGNTNISLPLPIELLSFDASVIQNEVLLQWATASELNNDYFTVQRSQSGESWEAIEEIKGSPESQVRIDYQATDTKPHIGVSYYRLKQTDYDGTSTYSSIKRVQVDESYQLKAYPNPTTGKLTVTTGFNLEPQDIRLLNTIGQQVPILIHQHGGEAQIEAINPPPGIYILQVRKGFWQQSLRIRID